MVREKNVKYIPAVHLKEVLINASARVDEEDKVLGREMIFFTTQPDI